MDAVDVGGGVATVGAGARLGRVYDALDAHGRTIAAGCGPDVGIAGLALGGGLGLLGRAHGLTCDQLLAAQVVLADGRIVDCDEEREADLFWALRGAGGGQFGVVDGADVPHARPRRRRRASTLPWPATAAAAVIDAWQAGRPTRPTTLAASLLVTAPATRTSRST